MAQEQMTVHIRQETMRTETTERLKPWGAVLEGIGDTLRDTGTPVQRLLSAVLLAALTAARLPGGGYACQAAMFAVFIRLGFCVPSAFLGVMAGFAFSYGLGMLTACWQMPVCALLWLCACLWAGRERRWAIAGAVFLAQLTQAAVVGVIPRVTLCFC